MKVRLATLLLFLSYLSVAVLQGNCHRHDTLAGVATFKNCSACLWQLNALADAPPSGVRVAHTAFAFRRPEIEEFSPAPQFSPNSASRAPPSVSSSNAVVG